MGIFALQEGSGQALCDGGAARGSGEVQAGEGGLCPPSPTAASGRLCSWTWLDKLQNTRLHEISR